MDAMRLPLEEAEFVPCETFTGACIRGWPWYHGEQSCVTGKSGFQQCCTRPREQAYIKECPTAGGGWQVSESGCIGFCDDP